MNLQFFHSFQGFYWFPDLMTLTRYLNKPSIDFKMRHLIDWDIKVSYFVIATAFVCDFFFQVGFLSCWLFIKVFILLNLMIFIHGFTEISFLFIKPIKNLIFIYIDEIHKDFIVCLMKYLLKNLQRTYCHFFWLSKLSMNWRLINFL